MAGVAIRHDEQPILCHLRTTPQHARNYQDTYPEVLTVSVQQSFYVDNWLESLPTISNSTQTVFQLHTLLAEGGFDMRQWVSNPLSIFPLKPDLQQQWLSQSHTDPLEPTLALRWNCAADTPSYQYRITEHSMLTMRTDYQGLASQYDPLGAIYNPCQGVNPAALVQAKAGIILIYLPFSVRPEKPKRVS